MLSLGPDNPLVLVLLFASAESFWATVSFDADASAAPASAAAAAGSSSGLIGSGIGVFGRSPT